MKCPRCGAVVSSNRGPIDDRHRVLETRYRSDGRSIRRRRQCTTCTHKFTTREYTIHDLAKTLALKESILTHQYIDKTACALEDIETAMANMMELQTMLKQQVEDAGFLDKNYDGKTCNIAI